MYIVKEKLPAKIEQSPALQIFNINLCTYTHNK